MKKIILIVLIAATGFASCKKLLDTKPNGNLVPENSYASEAQIKAALVGIYTNLKYGINYSSAYTTQFTGPTDESYYYSVVGFSSFAATANDNTSGNPTNMWKACYQSINFANSLLDNIDASAKGKVDSNVVRRAKGEAFFMRGFYYFLLAQWWGDVPMQLKATSDPLESQIKRTPVKDVYNQIIADMTLADSLLYDQKYSTQGYTERITRTAVEGMLARVCLYAAGEPVNDKTRFKDVIYWANKVVNSGEHGLLSSYSQVFIDESRDAYNQENMFEVGAQQNATGSVSSNMSVSIRIGVPMTLSNGTVSGNAVYDSGYTLGYLKLHPRLYYKYEPGDYRRDWNISTYTQSNTASVAFSTSDFSISAYGANGVGAKMPLASNKLWTRSPAKWRREYEGAISRSTSAGSTVNFPVLRYSDVLLMLAEAEYEVNGASAIAYNALNQVRRRSISPTKIVDSLSFVVGSGYTSAPAVTWTKGDGSGFGFNVVYSSSAKTVQVLLTNQGSGFTSVAPTITIGNQWKAATAYTAGTQVAAPNGRLYTVKTAGTSTATPPTNTSGDSPAGTTGAVFTYVGLAATAVASLSPTPVVDYSDAVLATKGIDFRQAIRDERARELCFESVRLPDLKRWGILVNTIKSLAADITGTNTDFPRIPAASLELSDLTPIQAPVNNVSQKDMFFPIPTWDLTFNKLLTQNPGYN
ncbi:MAG: RagB/SusD family nutrient uptake outer membrane protein [Lacibacter sp.]